MSNEPFYKSIKEIRDVYQNKDASVTEISNSFLERIKNLNPKINAYLEVFDKESISDAKKTDDYIKNGNKDILTGIIVGLKDLVDVKGKITSAGSKILEKSIAKSNSKITDDFYKQKSIIIGKTNLVEFAFGTLGINSNTPTCRNPWDLEKVPGGSSSGSAAAVSAGLCTFAIGTDTGGSVRMPASLCGITGFKPSYGIVSRRGVLDLSWSMDHVGPMARSAEDCLEVMRVISGFDLADKYSQNINSDFSKIDISNRSEISIGIPKNYFFDDIDADIKKTILSAANKFDNLGYKVEEIEIPFVEEGRNINVGVLLPEAISIHKTYLKNYEKYTKTVLNRLLGGLGVTADEYLAASRKMSKFNFEMSNLMKNYDILLTPTVPVKTPKIKDSESPNTPEANLMGKFTGVFNLTGQPSISVPAGLSKDNMPIGLMLSGRILRDNDVLNVAIDWQKETEFHKLIPDI
ncbi:MAG: hypothetical protein CL773_05200 [Chloroflexi bacterium]|nr:hypothetical protein [Chloroflexota bacterium]|tara:strand:- start:3889 stop:5277 length:1389 start_codon:yes stop_codon:yes gene_type:complete